MNLREAAEKTLGALDYYRSTDPNWHVSDETTYQELKTALAEAPDASGLYHRPVHKDSPNARPAFAVRVEAEEPDLSKCPACGGPADNGHDRCVPPSPYHCTKCSQAEEPVAWYHPSGEGYDSAFRDHSTVMACNGGNWSDWIPLYTHPPRREPLTEEEVRRVYREAWTPESEADEVLAFARAVERAHGIGRLPPVAVQPTYGGLGGDE